MADAYLVAGPGMHVYLLYHSITDKCLLVHVLLIMNSNMSFVSLHNNPWLSLASCEYNDKSFTYLLKLMCLFSNCLEKLQ